MLFLLRSGRQIFDRFQLRREWRPVIFALAPWVAGRVQLAPAQLALEAPALARHLSAALQPRERRLANDTQLQALCGAVQGGSCVLAVKGQLFSQEQQDTLGALVRFFAAPSRSGSAGGESSSGGVVVASVLASRRWLSTDSPAAMSRSFSMRLHVIRNGSVLASLASPPTANDDVLDFVQRALMVCENMSTMLLHMTHSSHCVMRSTYKSRLLRQKRHHCPRPSWSSLLWQLTPLSPTSAGAAEEAPSKELLMTVEAGSILGVTVAVPRLCPQFARMSWMMTSGKAGPRNSFCESSIVASKWTPKANNLFLLNKRTKKTKEIIRAKSLATQSTKKLLSFSLLLVVTNLLKILL